MRTLIVVRNLKLGGMERVAVNLADAFSQAGHESHLLTLREKPNQLSPIESDVTKHCLPLPKIMRLTLIGLLIEWVSRLVLNVVFRKSHFIWMGWLGGQIMRLWVKRFERKYGKLDLIVFRGIGTFEQVWSFKDSRAVRVLENTVNLPGALWQQRLSARCLFHKIKLVAVSEGVAETIRNQEAKWRITPISLNVIVNPCPIAAIRKAMYADVNIPDAPYIINVARLTKTKDQALLLRSYALAAPQEKLLIVGDGPERDRLITFSEKLGIEDRVVFTGAVDNPYPLMRGARLFVLSSRAEGMGIVLFEALACGTPVLSVDCGGGVRQILKGELEDAIVRRDAESLAQGMKAALKGGKRIVRDEWLMDFEPRKVVERFTHLA